MSRALAAYACYQQGAALSEGCTRYSCSPAYVAEGMNNLLFRVQNGDLDNTEEALHEAALRFAKRHRD